MKENYLTGPVFSFMIVNCCSYMFGFVYIVYLCIVLFVTGFLYCVFYGFALLQTTPIRQSRSTFCLKRARPSCRLVSTNRVSTSSLMDCWDDDVLNQIHPFFRRAKVDDSDVEQVVISI